MGRPWLSTKSWSSIMVAVLLFVSGSSAVVPEGHRSRRAMKAVRDRASGHSSDDGEAKTALASQTQVGARRSDTARGDDSFAQHGQVDEVENDEEQSAEQQESRPAAEWDQSVERLMLEEEGAGGEEEMEAMMAAKRAPPQASGPGAAANAASVRSPSLAKSRTSAHIAPASRVRSGARLGAATSTRKKLRTAAHAGTTRAPASGGSSLEGSDGGKVRAQEVRRSTGLQPAQGAVPRTVQFRKTVSTSRSAPSGSVEEEEPGNVASLRVEDIEDGREGLDRPTMDEAERESRVESALSEDNGDGKSDGVGAQPVGPEGSSDMQGEDAVEQEQDAVSDRLVDGKASTARKEKLEVKGKMPAASLARPGAAGSSTADRVESNEPGNMSTLPGPEVVAHLAVGGEEPAVAKRPSVTATEEQDGKAAEQGVDGGAHEERLVKVADEGRAQGENREQQPALQQEETEEEEEEKGIIGGEQGGAQEGETTAELKRTKGKESLEVGPLKHGDAKGHTNAGSAGMTEAGSRPLSGGVGVDVAETVKGGGGVTKPSASASLSEDKPVQDISVQPALEGNDERKTSAKVRRTAAVSKLRRRPDVDDDATIPSNTLMRSKVYGRPVQKEQEMLEEPGTKKQTSSAEYATTSGPLEGRRTMPALSKAERIRPARMGVLAGTAVEEAQEGQPEGDVEFDNLDEEARASTQQAQPIDAANQRTISTKSKDAMSAAAQGQRETPQEENRQAGGSDELGLAEEDQDEDALEDGEEDFDMGEVMEDEEEDDLVAATMPDSDAKSAKKAVPTIAEKGEDAQELVNLSSSKQTTTSSKSKGALGAATPGKKGAPLQQDRRVDDNDEGDSDKILDSAKSTEEEEKAEDGEDEADAEPFLDEDEMQEGDGEPVMRKKAVMGGNTAKNMLPKVAERGHIEDQILSSTAAKERTTSSTRKGAARAGAHVAIGAPEGPGREADDNEELDVDKILKAGQVDHDEDDAQQREHDLGAEEEELFIPKKAKLEAKPAKKALPKFADKEKSVDEEPAPMDGGRDKTTSSQSKDAVRATASGKKVAAETQDTNAEDDGDVDLDEILQMVEDGDEDEAEGEEADADLEGIVEPEGEDELVVTTKSAGKTLPKAGGKATENELSAEGSTLRQKEKGALNTVTAAATESVKPESSKAVPPVTKRQQGRRSGSKFADERPVGVGHPLKEGGDGAHVEEEGEGDDLSTLQTAFELPGDDEQEDGEAPSAAKTGRISAQSDAAKKTKKSRSPLADAEDDTTLLSAAVSLLANEASATDGAEEDSAAGNKETKDASRPPSEAGTTTRVEKGAAREEKLKEEVVETSKVTSKPNADPAGRDGGDKGEAKEPSKGLAPDTSRSESVGGKGPAGPAGHANDKDRTPPLDGKSPSTPVTADGGKKGADEKKGDESARPQPDGPKATLDTDLDTKKAANGGPIGAGGPKGQPRGADGVGEKGKKSGEATQPAKQPGKEDGPTPSEEKATKAAKPAAEVIQPKEPATEKKPREDEAVDTEKRQDPLIEGQGAVVRPPPSMDNTINKAPEVVKDTKKAKAEVKAKATTSCDPAKTCHGHGTCDDDGRCLCRAPWSGPSCLHNDCVDFEDCEGCVTSTLPGGTALLGCYWQDDECRGDGLYAPDMESCSGIGTWARIWSYLQYAVIGFVVVGFASLLIVRSRRPGGFTLFRNITTGYQPIPMNGGARGQQGREDWNWDPEEDNVELLATSGQPDESRPEPYTDKPPQQQQQPVEKHNGIYSMINTPAVEKSTKDTSAGPPVSTSTTASTNKPSSIGDDDIFAELGMEVVPSFKTSPTAHSPRESASAGPSTASVPTARSNRLGVSPIKTSVRDEEAGAEEQAAGWNDDDDIDGILDA